MQRAPHSPSEPALVECSRRARLSLTGPGDVGALEKALAAHEGVQGSALHGRTLLRVDYDVRRTSRDALEALAVAAGFDIPAGPVAALRRRFARYAEARQRELLEHTGGWDTWVQAAYVSRYRSRRHGRIDDRPEQWRRYVEGDREGGEHRDE